MSNRRRLMLRQAAVGGFTPTSIAGCTLWLDAADASTFAYSSGTLVSEWADKSGTSNDVAQATPANQPSRNATVNGLDAVDFIRANGHVLDGSGRLVGTSSGEYTVIAAVEPDLTSSGVYMVLDQDPGSGTRLPQLLRMFSSKWESIAFVGSGARTDPSATLFIAELEIISARADATSVEVWRDRTSNGSTATGGALNTGSIAFRVSNSSSGFDGRMCEIVVYDSALSTSDREEVESYLADKWGVTL